MSIRQQCFRFIVLSALSSMLICAVDVLSQVKRMSLNELVERADVVVRATAGNIEAKWVSDERGKHIYTTVTLSCEQVLKGTCMQNTFSLEVMGGTVDSVTERVSSSPPFKKDEEMVLFLTNKLELVGGTQGRVRIHEGMVRKGGVNVGIEKYLEKVQSIVKDPHARPSEEEEQDAHRGIIDPDPESERMTAGFAQSAAISSTDLLRRSTNNRIGAILQDVELSLRQLMTRCFAKMGFDEVKQKLERTRTDEQAVSAELRKSLQVWSRNIGSPNLPQEVSKHLLAYQKEFDQAHSLWAKVCQLYRDELGEEAIDPPLAKIVDYVTFNELANLLMSLETVAFPRSTNQDAKREPPSKRWPTYLARLRRLRNQSAHLRNVGFQDFEELLRTVKEMRWDIQNYG